MKFSAALILKSESFRFGAYEGGPFAALGGSRSRNATASMIAITAATAMEMISRLESRSSATGLCCPRLPMLRIVGGRICLVDFLGSTPSYSAALCVPQCPLWLAFVRQQLGRILVIDLPQNLIAQPEPIQRPVIVELLDLIKMFIERFQDAERHAVHRLVEAHVRPVNQPVGMLLVKV